MRYIGILQRPNRVHINDKRPTIGAHHVVGHTANPLSPNDASQLKGLAHYLSRRWSKSANMSRDSSSRDSYPTCAFWVAHQYNPDSLGVRAGGAADEQLYLPVRHCLS